MAKTYEVASLYPMLLKPLSAGRLKLSNRVVFRLTQTGLGIKITDWVERKADFYAVYHDKTQAFSAVVTPPRFSVVPRELTEAEIIVLIAPNFMS